MRILITLIALLFVAVPARAQVIVHYDEPPPATEAELFNKAVVVLRGRIEARRMEAPPGPKASVYSIRILELLKGGGVPGGLIDVHRSGGFDATTAEVDFAPFDVNEEVVLFLQRGQNGWYWPLSPDGAFKLTKDGGTHAYGKSGQVSKRHKGRPASEFLAELRKHKK